VLSYWKRREVLQEYLKLIRRIADRVKLQEKERSFTGVSKLED